MKCAKCQAENREGAKFCNECGHNFEIECPKCRASNKPGSKFCDECGHDLSQLEEVISLDFNHPQSYTPKHLADKILTTRSSIEGERKIVTVFFADVANYTSLADKLDPEEVHQIMDGCFRILMDEIHRFEGTINQFTGDGVMALFGAPVAHEDHAQRACYAALSIQKVIKSYSQKIKNDCGIDFKMRIGLNTGPVIVGSIGDDLRMDYTAVGDTTNLASRMEGMATAGAVLVSNNTHKLAKDFFEFEHLGKKKVKGKDESQEAYKLIKAGDIDTRIRASEVKGFTKFVGRKNSIAALQELFEKAKSGSGCAVGIVGEAGVGKSRLLREFRKQLPNDKYTYLEGRCLHYGGSMPYLPVLDIIRSYFEIKENDREYLIQKKINDKAIKLDKKLESIVSPILELLSVKTDDQEFGELDPKLKREKTFEALRDLFIRHSQENPLVLTVEDLHWIDNTTEEFLNYLIEWIANTGIMLILLYRPEYIHPWGSKSYYTKIGVDQLGKESSTELVKAMLDQGDLAPELKDLILSRAAGNPLFMEEFTSTLIENGSIQKKGKKYILNKESSDIQVPDTIQGIIAARMDRLEDNLKRTMQVASVIGKDFAFRILHTITGMKEELKSYLLNLQGLEFIYEKSLFPELEYIFKHALTQEVAYNSLLLARRKEIHENIGKAIEEIYSDRLEEFYEMLAYHYSKSENHDKAYLYLKKAGEKAIGNYAFREAFEFFKEAISILDNLPNTEASNKAHIEIRILIGRILHVLGYPDNTIQILEEGEKIAKETGDEKSLAVFCFHISKLFSFKGDQSSAIEYAEKSYQEAEKIKDLDLMVPPLNAIVLACMRTGEYQKISDMAPGIINLIEKAERTFDSFGISGANPYGAILMIYAFAKGNLGYFDEAELLFEKTLALAVQVPETGGLGAIEGWYGLMLRFKGDAKRSMEHSQKSIKILEEGGWPYGLGVAWSNLGYCYYMLGELDTAKKYIEKGLKSQNDLKIEQGLAHYYIGLSMVYCDSGKLEKALESAEKAVELSLSSNEKIPEGMSKIWLGRILGIKDPAQSAEAEKTIIDGIKVLEDLGLKPHFYQGYFFLGELYANTGQKDKALKSLKKAEGNFSEMGMDDWLKRTQDFLAGMK